MFDSHNPYERYYWHYESRQPLAMAQIIALQSVDVETAALVWLLLEHGVSLTVAGPTDPTPGVGKTTTLNALLQFLPEGTVRVYMSGMYENFAFTRIPTSEASTTYALCNEISDHLPIYMWGRVARHYLTLPARGYHIATSVHADTINAVIHMYRHDLRLSAADVRRLGLVIHIGLVGHIYPPSRRWLTTHFIQPSTDPNCPDMVSPIPLSLWNNADDTFEHADQSILAKLAEWIKIPAQDFTARLKCRVDCLLELSQGSGVAAEAMQDAIADLRKREQKSQP